MGCLPQDCDFVLHCAWTALWIIRIFPQEGITHITSADIKYARNWKYQDLKLLAVSQKMGEKFYARVSPVMINSSSPLYSVNDVYNAILVHGNMLGDAMFYGSGAGKLPTASAVVADVIDAAKHQDVNVMVGWSNSKLELGDIRDLSSRFFVRMKGSFTENLSRVEEVFGNVDAKVLAQVNGEFGFITEEMTEAAYLEKAEQFDNILGMIRVHF